MKILIANKRYFPSTGPEIYLFNIMRMFESDSHEIIPFSINRKNNLSSKYSKYFINHPARDTLYYQDYKINIAGAAKIFLNAIYSFPARKNIESLIRDIKPDLLYCLSTVNDISPSIIHSAQKYKIPIVMRISDYNLLCAESRFLNNEKVCKKCLSGNFSHAVVHNCVQNKFLPSLTRMFALYVHKLIRIYDSVNAFITPSAIMKEHMIQGGFPAERIFHIRSFTNLNGREPCYTNKSYILYFGRLSRDKGIDVLLRAIQGISVPLLIAGESTDGTKEQLEKLAKEKGLANVSFVGFKKGTELEELIKGALFTIIPSIWLENSPLSVLESMSYGKPVIGTNIGGIAETISDGEDGLLFTLGDENDLREKIVFLLNNPTKIIELGKKARQKVETQYSPTTHYNKLLELFTSIIKTSK